MADRTKAKPTFSKVFFLHHAKQFAQQWLHAYGDM
jgi:hypothetical protein